MTKLAFYLFVIASPIFGDVFSNKIEELFSFPETNSKLGATSLKIQDVVSSILEYQWDIQIAQDSIPKSWGSYQSTKGPFDPTFLTNYKYMKMYDPQQIGFKTDLNGDFSALSVGFGKLTRWGTKFSFTGDILDVFDPSLLFNYPPYSQYNQAQLSFKIEQPLLKRLGLNKESVDESVSRLEYEAIKAEFIQTAAGQIKKGIQDYWDLVRAQEAVEINRRAQLILKNIMNTTEKLIEAEKEPRSELNEQLAEISRANRTRLASEQDFYSIYNQLVVDMGQKQTNFSFKLPSLKLEAFPEPKMEKEDWDIDFLIELAAANRGDLKALILRSQEAKLRYNLAKKDLLPNLDLNFSVGYINSLIDIPAKPFFSGLTSALPEKTWAIELRFSYPLFNHQAKGEKISKRQELSQSQLALEKLYETIRADIASALRAQLEYHEELKSADAAVEKYKKALLDEIKRFHQGYSSLFIIIDFENRLERVLHEKILAYSDYAKNIVDLLYLTGMLVHVKDPSRDEISVDILNYEQLLKRYGCERTRR